MIDVDAYAKWIVRYTLADFCGCSAALEIFQHLQSTLAGLLDEPHFARNSPRKRLSALTWLSHRALRQRAMEVPVATVKIRCPATGRAITTGIEVEAAKFRRMPVFFSRSPCPHCKTNHERFAREAWIEESTLDHAINAA